MMLLFREEETVADVDAEASNSEEEQPEKALFCSDCGHKITSEDRAVSMHDSHHHTFFNPAGIIYEIRCFAAAPGCAIHGDASTEFTWFAGYAWRLALCGGCLTHMGWSFSSGEAGFYGLIAKKLMG